MPEQALPQPAVTGKAAHEPFFRWFHEDMDRHYLYHDRLHAGQKVSIFFVNQALWAVAAYRFGRSLKTRPIPLLQPLMWVLFRVVESLARIISGVMLDVNARIGPGLYVGHFGSIYIGPGVTIGRDFSLGQTCYVGPGGPVESPGLPVIGDRVWIGIGSKVLGGVRIGDDAAIGANGVVLSDIPAMAVAVGNPARVVNMNGSASVNRVRNRPPETVPSPPEPEPPGSENQENHGQQQNENGQGTPAAS